MGALTPQILTDLESRMQVLTESEYSRLNQNLWWRMVAKPRTTGARRQIFTWLLSTATIRDQDKGGNRRYDDLVTAYSEAEVKDAGSGLELRKNQLEDTDGNGMDLAGAWARDIGAYMAYWPQKRATYFLKNAHTASIFTGYDGKAFFATDHPVNPFQENLATYANIFTGAASGSYPGACPIDDSKTLEEAFANLSKIYAYISSIKMPNGEDPRRLNPVGLLVPPRLFPRAVQLTSSKFLAFAAAGGGSASSDVETLIKALGFSTPVQAHELAGFEDDKTFFVVCEQLTSSELGALVYLDREPFRINYYGNVDQVELNRKRTLEWHCDGRNSISAGHPYLLFKCKGS